MSAEDERASQNAADIKNDLERQGQMIGGYDLLIAGHARREGFAIVSTAVGFQASVAE